MTVNKTSTDETQAEEFSWPLLAIIATAYVAVGINMQGFPALLPFLAEEFGISRAEAGLYSSFYFLSATSVAIFSGRLADLLGARKGLIAGVTSIGCFMLLHSLMSAYWMILGLAFVTGIGFSVITPSVSLAVMESFPSHRRAMSMGVAHSGGGLGGFVGASILPLAAGSLGWRKAVLFAGGIAILMSLIIYSFYKNPEKKDGNPTERNSSSFRDGLLHLIRNRYLLTVCGMGFFLGAVMSSVSTHFALFLNQDLGMSAAAAGLGLGVLQIGGIFGQSGWGGVSDRLLHGSRRKSLYLLGVSVALLSLLWSTLAEGSALPLSVILALTLIIGIAALGGMALYFTTISELASDEYMGTATGLSLIFSRTGVIFGPPLFGLVSDITGSYRSSWLLLGLIVLGVTHLFLGISKKFAIRDKLQQKPMA